jgi:hypothetical protein
VARLRIHCCYGNTSVRYLFIVVGVDVAVSSTKVFSVAMEMKQWVGSLFTVVKLQNISYYC